MLRHRTGQRGSLLAITLVLTLIAAFSAASIVRYARDMHKLNERAIASEKATLTAEAGVYQALHYLHNPDDMPGSLSSAAAAIAAGTPETLATGSDETGGTALIDRDASLNPDLVGFTEDGADSPISRVRDLRILAPNATIDGYAAAPLGTEMRIYCVADATTTTNDTVDRTVVYDVAYTPGDPEDPPSIAAPAGLVAGVTAGANGHFNLHWGPAWSRGNISLKLNKKGDKNGLGWSSTGDNTINRGSTGEEWVTYESATGFVCDKGGTPIINDANIYEPGDYNNPGDYLNTLYQQVDLHTPAGEQTLSQKIDATLAQFTALNDPEQGYHYLKDIAMNRDTYFRVAPNGKVYNASNIEIFPSAAAAMEHYRDVSDAGNSFVAFFDTTNGQPPANDRSNWVNLSFSGSIEKRSQGLLYICGSFNTTGLPAPTVTIKNPDEVDDGLPGSESTRVYHEGIMFCWGDYRNTGNSVIYGSVMVNGTYDGGGNPNIYYNKALASGLDLGGGGAGTPRVDILRRQF